MDITKNYFEVFGLPVGFSVDLPALTERYRELQREIHPDRFAGAGDREQRLAVQFATYVNQAFESLKSPLLRAEYLLQLQGVAMDAQNQTTSDTAFLMRQMELRDELSEVRDQPDPEAALDALSAHVDETLSDLQSDFAAAYEQADMDSAKVVVSKLHFIVKLAHEVEQLEAELLDY